MEFILRALLRLASFACLGSSVTLIIDKMIIESIAASCLGILIFMLNKED